MSSILKALEKVEESRNARRNGGASGLVRARERRPAWVVPAGVLGGAVVAALATFAAMGGFSRTGAPVRQEVALQQSKAVEKSGPASVAPLYTEIDTQAAQPEQARPIEPAQTVVVPIPKTPPVPSPTPAARPAVRPARVFAPAVPVARPAPVQPTSLQATPLQVAPVKAAPVAEPVTPVVPEVTRPEIRVTGIAWQKASGSSAAIVNGRSVQQGGMVDGYKVEEILEDKVRLSGSRGNLEVQLGGGE
jgi:general secretion pathway protein B